MKIPFVGQAYENRSLAISAQRCVNLYPEVVDTPEGGRSVTALHGTPGLLAWTTAGSGPIRGMCVMGETDNSAGTLYVVTAQSLYSVNTSGTATLIGTIAGTGRVSMDVKPVTTAGTDTGLLQLCIVNGTQGYTYDTTSGLELISDADFQPAYIVAQLKGYFVFAQADSDIFFVSELGDGQIYSSADTGKATSNADSVISLVSDHEEIWIFGHSSVEIYYAPGDTGTDFPLEKVQGTYIERGCAARYTPVKIDNSVMWLGDDLVVYRAQGYVPQRVSTHAIEHAIKGYTTTKDAFAWHYTDEGHKFYVLTFPTAGATWVYDVATNMWHERESFGLSRWRVNAYAKYNGKHYVGDYSTNNIYELDMDTYTENGSTLQRIRSTTHIHADSNPVFMNWLQLIIESGTGINTGQGSDPQIMLRYSDDGGRTWSNERWADMGKIGEFFRRVRWNRLGRFYQRTFEVTISDPVKVALLEADADLEMGNK